MLRIYLGRHAQRGGIGDRAVLVEADRHGLADDRADLGEDRRQIAVIGDVEIGAYGSGMIRFMKPSNSGTVKAVSPWAGL